MKFLASSISYSDECIGSPDGAENGGTRGQRGDVRCKVYHRPTSRETHAFSRASKRVLHVPSSTAWEGASVWPVGILIDRQIGKWLGGFAQAP